MWPDAQKFSEQFKKTKFDLIVGTVFEETFKIVSAIAATAALGAIGAKYHAVVANIAYWICAIVLSGYVGTRFTFLIYGLARRNDPYRILSNWVMVPFMFAAAGANALLVMGLVRAIVAVT